MTVNYIDHYLVRTQDIEKSKQFYVDVLKLKVGYRPAFSFKGYWLYANESPIVHLLEVNKESSKSAPIKRTSSLGHIAFNADNFEEMLRHLQKLNISFQHRIVPEENGAHQIFIEDPDGIGIELNFPITINHQPRQMNEINLQ